MKRLLFFALLPALLTAQIKYSISGGTAVFSAFGTDGTKEPLAHYWSNGISISAGIERSVVPAVTARAWAEYSTFSFNSYNEKVPAVTPMNIFLYVPNYTLVHADGDRSSVTRVMMEGRYDEPLTGSLELQLSTGFGITREMVGNVRATWDDGTNSTFSYTMAFKQYTYPVHSAGAGLRYSLLDGLAVETAVKYYSNYTDRMQYSFMLGAVLQ
jgi:hypothetical protein